MKAPSAWAGAKADVLSAISDARLWFGLGWTDIRRQYRRSFLGPLWMVASAAIFVAAFSVIGAGVFGSDAARYVPYLAIGHVVFGFFSTALNEACLAFLQSEHMLRQVPMSKLVPPLRSFCKNGILLAHTMIVPLATLVIFGVPVSVVWWSVLPAMLLLGWTVLMLVIVLAIVNLRYRDTAMIVSNATMILFFVTPVFWPEENLTGRAEIVVNANPVAAMLRMLRQPLLEGQLASVETYLLALGFALACTAAAVVAFVVGRRRVVYWL